MSEDYGYKPQLPALVTPTTPSGVEHETRVLNRARFATNPVSSIMHRISEHSVRKALEATGRRFAAQKIATDNYTQVVESVGAKDEALLRLQTQRELSRLRHEFALEQGVMALHIEFNRGKELLHNAQRAAITAQHGAEAATKFKELNFRLGEVRKEARLQETADLVEQPKALDAEKREATVEELLRLRNEMRLRREDTRAVDDTINEFATRVGIAAE